MEEVIFATVSWPSTPHTSVIPKPSRLTSAIYLCENTFRKYKKAAIKVIGEILWGYEDRESVGILKKFAAENYGEDEI